MLSMLYDITLFQNLLLLSPISYDQSCDLCHQIVTDVTALPINPNPSYSKNRNRKEKEKNKIK